MPPPSDGAPPARWLLELDGVDGIAGVTLDGAELGVLASAHRPHLLDVTRLLSPASASDSGGSSGSDGSASSNSTSRGGGSSSNHTLTVTIVSAVAASQAAARAYPYEVPRTQQKGAIGAYNFIRKAASDFGW